MHQIAKVLVLVLGFLIIPFPACVAADDAEVRNDVSKAPYTDLLLGLLRQKQFSALDAKLSELQHRYEIDTNAESDLVRAFRVFGSSAPELAGLLDAWRVAMPNSHAAQAASGQHHLALAWAWRGHEFIGKTHPARLEYMHRNLEKAQSFFKRSLELTRIPVVSLAGLIEIERMSGTDNGARAWLDQANRLDPSNSAPRHVYMSKLQPRWGGSYAQMEAFAREVASKANDEKTRKLARALAVMPLGDQAKVFWAKGDLAAAIRLYEQAVAESDEDVYRIPRARLYSRFGQLDRASSLFDRAAALNPDDGELRYYRFEHLVGMSRHREGAEELRLAAEAGYLDAWTDWGIALIEGRYGLPADTSQGMAWVELAAHFWDVRAVFMIGKTYERGLGVPVDFAMAAPYYRLAADQYYGPAENDLGLFYWYGRGVPQDQDEAIRLWKAADKQGIWQARHNLNYFLTPVQRVQVAASEPVMYYTLIQPRMIIGLLAVWVLIAFWLYIRLGRQK